MVVNLQVLYLMAVSTTVAGRHLVNLRQSGDVTRDSVRSRRCVKENPCSTSTCWRSGDTRRLNPEDKLSGLVHVMWSAVHCLQ